MRASASHREKYAPAAWHYGAIMPARYNIVLYISVALIGSLEVFPQGHAAIASTQVPLVLASSGWCLVAVLTPLLSLVAVPNRFRLLKAFIR